MRLQSLSYGVITDISLHVQVVLDGNFINALLQTKYAMPVAAGAHACCCGIACAVVCNTNN